MKFQILFTSLYWHVNKRDSLLFQGFKIMSIKISHKMTEIPEEIKPKINSETKTWWIGSTNTGIPYNTSPKPLHNILEIPSTGSIGEFFILNNKFYAWDDSNNRFESIGTFKPQGLKIQQNNDTGYLECSEDNGESWTNMLQISDIIGPQGEKGDSAFKIAQDNGYNGTESSWIESLNAYGIAKQHGFVGTQEEWLQSLKVHLDSTIFDNNTKIFITRNIGEQFKIYGNVAPIGALELNGQEVDFNVYKKLYAYAQSKNLILSEVEWTKKASKGYCAYFSEKNSQGKFKVPLIHEVNPILPPNEVEYWQVKFDQNMMFNSPEWTKIPGDSLGQGTWIVDKTGWYSIRFSLRGNSSHFGSLFILLNGAKVFEKSGIVNNEVINHTFYAIKGNSLRLSRTPSNFPHAYAENSVYQNQTTTLITYGRPLETNVIQCIQAFDPTTYSAQTSYEAWRSLGNSGTMSDFLESLNAYGVARDRGYSGTKDDWLNSLKGKSAYQVAIENGFNGNEQSWLESLKGADGSGVTILGSFDSTGQLPSSGNVGDAYMIQGNLWIWPRDGSSYIDAGPIRGPKGDMGPQGAKGDNGENIKFLRSSSVDTLPSSSTLDKVYILDNGDMYQYQDMTWVNIGNFKGPKGDQGPKGEPLKFNELTNLQKSELKGEKGDIGPIGPQGPEGKRIQLFKGLEYLQWKYEGESTFVNLMQWEHLKGPKGDTGPQGQVGSTPMMKREEGEVKYSRTNGTTWETLYSLDEIKGPKGDSPSIKESTKTWVIGNQDTGIKAQGDVVTIDNETKKWRINGIDTNVRAEGSKVEIDQDQNWVIDGVSTNIRAVGLDSYWTAILDGTKLYGSSDGITKETLLFDFNNITPNIATPNSDVHYVSFNNALEPVWNGTKDVYVDIEFESSKKLGTKLAPFSSLNDAIIANSSSASSTKNFFIAPGTYDESIVISNQSSRYIFGRKICNSWLTSFTSLRLHNNINDTHFKDIHVKNGVNIESTGNASFESCKFDYYTIKSGNGKVIFKDIDFFKNITISGPGEVIFENCRWYNSQSLYINNSQANVTLTNCINVSMHCQQGSLKSEGYTTFIKSPNISNDYGLLVESTFGSFELESGTIKNLDGTLAPIQINSNECNLGFVSFDVERSSLPLNAKYIGYHSKLIFDETNRDGYTKENTSLQGHLDAISNELVSIKQRLGILEG